jgi:hypothetical protein
MMKHNDDILDDIFTYEVESIKKDEVKVENPDDQFDNVLYVLGYQHGVTSLERWLEHQLSLFPGISRFHISDKATMTDDEWKQTIKEYGTQRLEELYKMSYVIRFDMFTGSILEVRALLMRLSRRIIMCKLNNTKIVNLETIMHDEPWNHSLYASVHTPKITKDEYYHCSRKLKQIECDNSLYDVWMLDSILLNDYGLTYDLRRTGEYIFKDLRINPKSDNLVFMNMYNALYDDLRKQAGRLDCLATKVEAGHMQVIQAAHNSFYEKLMPIRSGSILFRTLSRNMPRALIIVLETQLDDDEEYMRQWLIFQIPGEDLSVLHDILSGPKKQIDCIINEASKKLSTFEVDVRTDGCFNSSSDTSASNIASYTKPLYAYAGRYVGKRYLR